MSDPNGLGWSKGDDPVLYDLYARKLPWKGWPGAKTPEEKAYIRKFKDGRHANGQD